MSVPPELLQAARAEFSRNGYKATSIAAIANRAGIAVGSVYLHYSSKYELFRDVYNETNNQYRQQLMSTIDWTNPKEAFSKFLTNILSNLKQDRILSEWLSPDPGEKLRKESSCTLDVFYTEQLTRWRTEGVVNPNVTDATLLELIDALRLLDKENILSLEAMSFLIHALLDAIFPDPPTANPTV